MNGYQMMLVWIIQTFSCYSYSSSYLHCIVLWHSFHGTGVILNSNISASFLERNSNIHCITFWVALLVYFFLVRCIENGFVSVCECKPLFFGISILSIKITSIIVHYRTAPNQKFPLPIRGVIRNLSRGGASILFLSRGGLAPIGARKPTGINRFHWSRRA